MFVFTKHSAGAAFAQHQRVNQHRYRDCPVRDKPRVPLHRLDAFLGAFVLAFPLNVLQFALNYFSQVIYVFLIHKKGKGFAGVPGLPASCEGYARVSWTSEGLGES
jgi:hypothetical protein